MPGAPLTSTAIKAKARELGFDVCGVAPAAAYPELEMFADWIARGYAGSMAYLARSAHRRADVRHVLPSAQTVIVTATNYNTDRPFSTECADPSRAQISRYGWGDDYHEVLGARLETLLEWMRSEAPEPFDARSYVDTGPVQERVYAQYAGVGWVGKNTCVIHPTLGSFVFLGEIICSLPLAVDEPALDQCGTCTLCLEACPTQAFPAERVLDATRCISYLTIEHRGEIPAHLIEHMGTHVYGCDICQEVCPYNGHAPIATEPAWQPRSWCDEPSLAELSAMSDDALDAATLGSPMRRAKVSGLRRNIGIAVQNGRRRGEAAEQTG